MNQDAMPLRVGGESEPDREGMDNPLAPAIDAASGDAATEAQADAEPQGALDAQGDPAAQGDADPSAEQPRAPRFTLLIRAAKLICANGEFVCVIRDVSETGVSLRLFHALPSGAPYEIQFPSGSAYEVEPIWERGHEAGLKFAQKVDVARLINEAGDYPKRGLRLDLCFPVELRTLTKTCEAVIVNLSQQGARFESDCMFAIEQSLRVAPTTKLPEFDEVRAKIRWRRGSEYGVVFDDTFSLGDFARLAARLQAPGLLSE